MNAVLSWGEALYWKIQMSFFIKFMLYNSKLFSFNIKKYLFWNNNHLNNSNMLEKAHTYKT